MAFETAEMSKRLAADGTDMRLFACVYYFVNIEMSHIVECFPAHMTHVWPWIRMALNAKKNTRSGNIYIYIL